MEVWSARGSTCKFRNARIQSLYLYFNYFIKIVPFWLRNTVDGFIFVGTNFRGLNENDTFVGFKIRGHSIFPHNSYRKSLIRGYWNSLIGPSTKTTKIGTPRKLSHPQYPFFNTKHPIILLRASLFVVTPSHVASWKIECQNFSYVYRSRKHWECKYWYMNSFSTIIRIALIF